MIHITVMITTPIVIVMRIIIFLIIAASISITIRGWAGG